MSAAEKYFPEGKLLRLLAEGHRTFAAAESCTGGLIAQRITALPGASAVFRGGAVVYTNWAKTVLAGVPEEVLAAHGAVSRPVAALLAQNIRELLAADYGVSVTGLAGPEGDGVHPVGTVYVALASPEGTEVHRLSLPAEDGREAIRRQAADFAFGLLCAALEGNPLEEQPAWREG